VKSKVATSNGPPASNPDADDEIAIEDFGFDLDDTAPSSTREDLPSLANDAQGAHPAEPMPHGPEMESDDDPFREIPTVSNRANPTAEIESNDFAPANEPHTGVGAYRLVRPATSDRIEPQQQQQPAPGQKTQGNRVVIGVARKTNS
jgi:hypothetical protein